MTKFIRIFALVLALTLLFAFASCGNEEKDTPKNTENTAEQTKENGQPAEPQKIDYEKVLADSFSGFSRIGNGGLSASVDMKIKTMVGENIITVPVTQKILVDATDGVVNSYSVDSSTNTMGTETKTFEFFDGKKIYSNDGMNKLVYTREDDEKMSMSDFLGELLGGLGVDLESLPEQQKEFENKVEEISEKVMELIEPEYENPSENVYKAKITLDKEKFEKILALVEEYMPKEEGEEKQEMPEIVGDFVFKCEINVDNNTEKNSVNSEISINIEGSELTKLELKCDMIFDGKAKTATLDFSLGIEGKSEENGAIRMEFPAKIVIDRIGDKITVTPPEDKEEYTPFDNSFFEKFMKCLEESQQKLFDASGNLVQDFEKKKEELAQKFGSDALGQVLQQYGLQTF